MTRDAVTTVVVVIPVHNEAQLLDLCLTAVEASVEAAAHRGIRCTVQVVLDDCSDGSAAVVARHPFPSTVIAAASVGEARAWGVDVALSRLEGVAAGRVWIANTDADSAVPPNWIVEQCDVAARGADVFVGTVRPDFADLGAAQQRHWLRTHLAGSPNGHVHGASLGVRASVYQAVDGFRPLPEHEDVDLVERCRDQGARIWASDAAEVLTSGRFVGRTPGGYAGYLRAQAEALGRESLPGRLDRDDATMRAG